MADFPKQLLERPSGFPDLSPSETIALNRILDVIRRHFERAGYAPLETSLVERPEVLLAKSEGEITTQVYGLRLLNPAPGADDAKDLALRYDHTIPLARYVATHDRELAFPYRRYAIGKVLRGERSKDGRYREFIQADIDTIGDTALALVHDAEMAAVIAGIFQELAIGPFTIRINNRKVLAGLIRGAGLSNEKVSEAMRAIDRLEKVGADDTCAALAALGADEARARTLLDALTERRSVDESLTFLKGQELDTEFVEGATELAEVITGIRALGVNEGQFVIDLSIARGLEYYTGTVYETRLDEHADVGSIASGGRYADLASAFTTRSLPGVGISIGVSRLLSRLIKAGLVDTSAVTVAPVLVTSAEYHALPTYLEYAARLRKAGINTESYLAEKPLDKQMQFADRKGFKLAVIASQGELDRNTVVIRDLITGTQEEVPTAELEGAVHKALG